MITEDYVSFEVAKLLKEKGFDEECSCFYNNIDYGTPGLEADGQLYYKNSTLDDEEYATPTLQMAMKWLREVYNILLVVDYEYECDNTPYYFKIYKLGENGKPERVLVKGVSYDKNNNAIEHIVGYRDWERSKGDYSNYEQACESGIKYCLEKLI